MSTGKPSAIKVEQPKCLNCFYFRRYDDKESEFGICHRYAPRPHDKYNSATHWPIVDEVNWCGEWKSK